MILTSSSSRRSEGATNLFVAVDECVLALLAVAGVAQHEAVAAQRHVAERVVLLDAHRVPLVVEQLAVAAVVVEGLDCAAVLGVVLQAAAWCQ